MGGRLRCYQTFFSVRHLPPPAPGCPSARVLIFPLLLPSGALRLLFSDVIPGVSERRRRPSFAHLLFPADPSAHPSPVPFGGRVGGSLCGWWALGFLCFAYRPSRGPSPPPAAHSSCVGATPTFTQPPRVFPSSPAVIVPFFPCHFLRFQSE